MRRCKYLIILTVFILLGCNQQVDQEIELVLLPEIQTESNISSLADCYNEMRYNTGEQFQGTSCQICGNYSSNPGDTILLYGVAFFYDALINSIENTNYGIEWSIVEGAGTLIPTDDPRSVQLVIPEFFSEIIIRLHNESENGLVVAENFGIRNTMQAIEITDPGQAGLVMFDKGHYTDSWRYLEVTPGVVGRSSTDGKYETQWGCLNQEIGTAAVAVGDGKLNAVKIVEFMNDIPDYQSDPNARCGPGNDGSVASWVIDEYSNNGFTDWHLPSLEEAKMVAQNLRWFSEDLSENETYLIWTSSEIDAELAYAVDLYSGEALAIPKHLNLRAMGVRYF